MQRIAAVVFLVACAASANAATFTVTSSADSGPATLRDAILQANALAGRDKIQLNVTAKPTSALPAIDDAVDVYGGGIDGTAAGSVTDGLVVRGDRSTIAAFTIANFGGDGLVMDGAYISAYYIRSRNNRNGVRVNSAHDGLMGSNIDANRENGILVSSQARYFSCGGRDSDIGETPQVSVHTTNNGAAGLRVEGSDSNVEVISTGNAGDGAWIAGARNLVMNCWAQNNGGNGFVVFTGNRPLFNNGACNGKMLFDVNGDGPTPNDMPEADGVPNAPVLESVISSGNVSTVIGTLTSTPLTTFHLQFYEFGDDCISWLAATDHTVTTDAAGHASFRVGLPANGPFAVQTSRELIGEIPTSEFSNVLGVTSAETTSNADLSIEAHVLNAAVSGELMGIEYTITNHGPSISGIFQVPTPATAGANSRYPGFCYSAPCPSGPLASGESQTFAREFVVTGAAGTSIAQTATIVPASTHPDALTANNSVTLSVPIVAAAAVPALSTWALGAVVLALAGFAMLRLRA